MRCLTMSRNQPFPLLLAADLPPAGVVLGALGVVIILFALRPRPQPFRFVPPRLNRLVVRLVEWQLPWLLRRLMHVTRVELSDDDLARLRALTRERCALCPNHPTTLDPLVLFELGRRTGQPFHYLGSVESFATPLARWLLPAIGGYSIMRGTVDRESFRMTRQLLAAGSRPLVILPEGEACGHNDLLMPLQQGPAQFGFWALEDLAKVGPLPPLRLVPITLRYEYERDMADEINRALARLEAPLGLAPATGQPSYERLRQIGLTLIAAMEHQYEVRPAKDASFDARMQAVKEEVVARAARMLGVIFKPEQPLLERLRQVFVAADRFIYEAQPASLYEHALHHRREREIRALHDDLWRMLRFVAFRDGYVGERPTAERFLTVIARLEEEVLGAAHWRGPQRVIVSVGEPVDLTAFIESYHRDKRAAVGAATHQLETALRAMLEV